MTTPAIFKPSNDASSSITPFFSKDPVAVFDQGEMLDVPVMTGITRDDGIITASGMIETQAKFEKFM